MGQVARIALVHDFIFTFGGAERVLKQLHSIFPDAPIYTTLGDPNLVQKHFPQAEVHYSYLLKHPFKGHPAWLLSSYPKAVESFDFNGYDLVISSSGAFSHGIITGPDTAHLCYCHTPMRYVWDWHAEYLREKNLDGPLMQFLIQPKMHSLRLWDYYASKRVDRWIANSTTVKDRIQTYYQQDSTVVFPPVDTDFFQPQSSYTPHKQPYAISCGRLTPNKRVSQIIEACALAKIPLHIVGSGSQEEELKKLAITLNAEVFWHGGVGEEAKRDLIGSAACFVFAAEDDFGIAPVEALSMGVPVIALGKGGSLDYVRHQHNGLLYPQPSAASLHEALSVFLKDGVKESPSQIRSGALRFGSQHFSTNIKKVVHDMLS